MSEEKKFKITYGFAITYWSSVNLESQFQPATKLYAFEEKYFKNCDSKANNLEANFRQY